MYNGAFHQARGGTVSWSGNNAEHGIALHYNAPNRLAGIEILDAAQRLDNPETLKQVVFAKKRPPLDRESDRSRVVSVFRSRGARRKTMKLHIDKEADAPLPAP